MKKMFKWLIVLGLFGFGGWWFFLDKEETVESVAYKTTPVITGQVFSTIRATGTIEPEDLIDIGAQITGQIMAFGVDTEGKEVDYCSEVRKGQLLARIDDVTYKAEVTIATANLNSANARLDSANANVLQLRAKLHQAERDWTRATALGVGDALSQKEYDAYQSAYESALAAVDVGKASVAEAQASIAQAQAQLEKAQRNLSYCEIMSTVDGIVIDRRVNIGQTVTASMNTPSLFLVAKDLKRIEIWVPVNEADIGEIHEGQEVVFTVDAFPNKDFTGTVRRIRLNAAMSSNVVTYTVEVATENPEGVLLPYLTANVEFILGRSAPDALLVPPAALRWQPEDWTPPAALEGKPVVFVQTPNGIEGVPVEIQLVGDNMTAVTSPQLKEGDSIITGVMTPIETAQAKAKGKNPFVSAPSFGQKNKQVGRRR
ncbi:MAG: efflux RND transporter periplasmic adaptor subunit [bacterium]|nr:efflux RND transporter periplasmic adaptor subunit [bacterium]MDO5462164.1 efflux RND transporter periplasmic adaptor subunit [bacterium]